MSRFIMNVGETVSVILVSSVIIDLSYDTYDYLSQDNNFENKIVKPIKKGITHVGRKITNLFENEQREERRPRRPRRIVNGILQ